MKVGASLMHSQNNQDAQCSNGLVQGSCSADLPEFAIGLKPPLLPLAASQCLLLSNSSFPLIMAPGLPSTSTASSLVVSRLYLRQTSVAPVNVPAANPSWTSQAPILRLTAGGACSRGICGRVWMDAITVQGDWQGTSQADRRPAITVEPGTDQGTLSVLISGVLLMKHCHDGISPAKTL
jgi:hypothetical protein